MEKGWTELLVWLFETEHAASHLAGVVIALMNGLAAAVMLMRGQREMNPLLGYSLIVSVALIADSPAAYIVVLILLATSFSSPEFLVKLAEQIWRNTKKTHHVFENMSDRDIDAKVQSDIQSVAEGVLAHGGDDSGAGTEANGDMLSFRPITPSGGSIARVCSPQSRQAFGGTYLSYARLFERLAVNAIEDREGRHFNRNVRLVKNGNRLELDGISDEGGDNEWVLEVKLVLRPVSTAQLKYVVREVARHFRQYEELVGHKPARRLLVLATLGSSYLSNVDLEDVNAAAGEASPALDLKILSSEDIGLPDDLWAKVCGDG